MAACAGNSGTISGTRMNCGLSVMERGWWCAGSAVLLQSARSLHREEIDECLGCQLDELVRVTELLQLPAERVPEARLAINPELVLAVKIDRAIERAVKCLCQTIGIALFRRVDFERRRVPYCKIGGERRGKVVYCSSGLEQDHRIV